MGLVKDSGNTMEGKETTGLVLEFPVAERIFPLEEDSSADEEDGGGIEGTGKDGLFISALTIEAAPVLLISIGTGGGAIGRRSFWGGGGGGGAIRSLSLGSPEWGATAMMGRFASGPSAEAKCVGRDRLRLWLEPIVAPEEELVVEMMLNSLETIVRT